MSETHDSTIEDKREQELDLLIGALETYRTGGITSGTPSAVTMASDLRKIAEELEQAEVTLPSFENTQTIVPVQEINTSSELELDPISIVYSRGMIYKMMYKGGGATDFRHTIPEGSQHRGISDPRSTYLSEFLQAEIAHRPNRTPHYNILLTNFSRKLAFSETWRLTESASLVTGRTDRPYDAHITHNGISEKYVTNKIKDGYSFLPTLISDPLHTIEIHERLKNPYNTRIPKFFFGTFLR